MRSCPACGDQAPVGAQFCICCGAVVSLVADGPTQRISAGLAAEGSTHYLPLRPLTRWLKVLPLVGIVILVLYSALILWPAYESGMAWFKGNQYEGNPAGDGVFDAYQPWYFRSMPQVPTAVADVLSAMLLTWTVLLTLLVGRYLLLPLGVGTLLWLRAHWSNLRWSERTGMLLMGLVEIVVPVLTWAASYQFLIWFLN